MNYVVLHIDLEFIVSVVYTDNGSSYPVTNGNEDLLWLYFFNDPNTNRISFGKNNRIHSNNSEMNYYGRFFEQVENNIVKFKRGEFQKDIIELLEFSDLLKTIKEKYKAVTLDNTECISTLLTFSLSISELAKQKTIEYLSKRGFKIDSYTIPLSELVCYYPYSKKDFVPQNGSSVLLLTATNAALHLMRLTFSNKYFMLDSQIETYEGMGVDPRKRALVGYVVEQINVNVGALNSNQIPREISLKEFKAEEWLKRIDAKSQNDNTPVRITESLSPMPNSKRDVLVRKSDIETFTNDYINLLMDYYNAYKNKNINGDISAIFLLGDCFQNALIKERFSKLIRDEKLFIYTNKDIRNILSVYPKIDFKRYINEEERIKIKAIAEEQKKAEQRALEDQQRKADEAEEKRLNAEKKAEENRREAQKLYEHAVMLDKEGKLQDALINMENAINLDSTNADCEVFFRALKDKQNELKIRTDQYKSLLRKAESHIQDKKLVSAVNVYELAKELFDNVEIRNIILETKEKIRLHNQQLEEIGKLLNIVDLLFAQGNLEEAKLTVSRVLEIDKECKEATSKLIEIESLLQETEIRYKVLINAADLNLKNKMFEAAINTYKEALRLKPNDKYCLKKITEAQDEKKTLVPPPPPISKVQPKSVSNSVVPKSPIAPPPPLSKSVPLATSTVNRKGKSSMPPPPPIVPFQKNSTGSCVPPPPPKKK